LDSTGQEKSGFTGTVGGDLRFDSGDLVEAMRIDNAGNVGIGTSSPGSRLEVRANDSTVYTPTGTSSSLPISNASINIRNVAGVNNTGAFVRFYTTDGFGGRHAYFGAISDGSNLGATMVFGRRTGSGAEWAETMRITNTGALILAGSTAQKATGTTWSNPSDQRLKDNIRDYTKGTAELMQVRVREWEYNGKGGTVEGTKGLGVVADEVMAVLPDTVANYEAKLNADDEEVTAIKKFDATEITWLLVKTVQEQQAIINDLKARLDAANL
jgi:hypothetical protein